MQHVDCHLVVAGEVELLFLSCLNKFSNYVTTSDLIILIYRQSHFKCRTSLKISERWIQKLFQRLLARIYSLYFTIKCLVQKADVDVCEYEEYEQIHWTQYLASKVSFTTKTDATSAHPYTCLGKN